MTPIIRALALGYAAPQILEFVSRAFPSLTGKIKKAQSSGYSVDQILKILNQGMGGDSNLPSTEAQIQNRRDVRRENIANELLSLGGASLGGLAASKAFPGFVNSLKGSLGPSSSVGAEAVGGALQSGSQIDQPQISPQQPPPLPEQLQQQAPQQQISPSQVLPQNVAQQPPSFDSATILTELGLDEKINNLLAQGKAPEQVSREVVGGLNPKQRKLFTEKVAKGEIPPTLESVIRDYASKVQPLDIQAKQAAKPVKGNLVETPDGMIGTIEHIQDKQALVKDENGKTHKVLAKDLQDLTDKYKDVHIDVSNVPESERSAPLYGVTPRHDQKSIQVEFFPKDENVSKIVYEYFRKDGERIPEELQAKLREGMAIPVSSGIEWSGFWNAEEADSRGSTFHHDLKMQAQDLDKVEQGKEQDNPSIPYWFVKVEKIFEHGIHTEAKKEFGKRQKAFKQEYKEMTGGKTKKRKP